jgi:hypothetical protein
MGKALASEVGPSMIIKVGRQIMDAPRAPPQTVRTKVARKKRSTRAKDGVLNDEGRARRASDGGDALALLWKHVNEIQKLIVAAKRERSPDVNRIIRLSDLLRHLLLTLLPYERPRLRAIEPNDEDQPRPQWDFTIFTDEELDFLAKIAIKTTAHSIDSNDQPPGKISDRSNQRGIASPVNANALRDGHGTPVAPLPAGRPHGGFLTRAQQHGPLRRRS